MISRKRAGKQAFAFIAGVACLMGTGMGSVSCDMLDNSAAEGKEDTEVLASQSVPCVVSFNASFDEIYTKDETKSSAESCMRLKWSAGDDIWAYTLVGGVWKYAGKLEVAETGYTAKVGGELTIVPESDLYLLHVSNLQAAPEISADGSVTIDMSDQAGSTMVVAYGKIENVSVVGGVAAVDEKVLFSFANSFIRVNCCDLPYKDDDGNIMALTFTNGAMTNVNRKIGISFGDEVTVTGSDEGDIAINANALNQSLTGGKAVTWVSIPPVDLDTDRSIYFDCTLASNSEILEYKAEKVARSAHGAGELINTIAQFKQEDVITNISIAFGPLDGNLTSGKTQKLSLSYKGNYLYGDSLVWTSSDTTVGTVDQTGLFTALKSGKTTVEVTGKYTYFETFFCVTTITVE